MTLLNIITVVIMVYNLFIDQVEDITPTLIIIVWYHKDKLKNFNPCSTTKLNKLNSKVVARNVFNLISTRYS